MKFSTCRAASQRHRYGPAGTTVHSPFSSSGTSGSGHRGSSSATQISPYRSCTRYAATRALAGTAAGSSFCGIATHRPSAPYRQPW